MAGSPEPEKGPKYTQFAEMSPNSRSFYQRTLGKMEAGALRGAIFTLISTCIGAGCLTLPLIFERQGIFLAILILFFSCICCYVGILNISLTAESYKCYEYSALVEKVLGKNMKMIFDNTLILYVFGTLIGYQVMVGNFIPSIFHSINISFDPDLERIIVMVAVNILIMIPLGLLRTLTALRFASLLSAMTLIYISILIISEFPFYAKDHSYDNIEYFKLDLSILPSFNICLYSFTCHTNVAQIYDELNNRNLKRMGKVARRAMFSILIPYIALGLFGYLSLLNDTPQLIIMRKAPDSISNDWLMVIARVLMAITLTIAVPINIPPCRSCVAKSWFKVKDRTSNKLHYGITITLLVLSLVIAIVYPKILVLFSVLGGFCCGIIVIIIPSTFYLGLLKVKTQAYEKNSIQAILYTYGSIILFLIGTTGSILSISGQA